MKKTILFHIIILVTLLTFSTNTYAKTEKETIQNFTINSQFFFKHSENKCIYNNKIVTISAFSSTNHMSETLNWLEIKDESQTQYKILDNDNISNKNIMEYYYELNDDGDIFIISRDIKEFCIKNINANTKNIYSLDKIPEWVDNVYTYYEIQTKIEENSPEFLLNEIQEVAINNTLYYVFYKNNKWHYFNTKTFEKNESKFTYTAKEVLNKGKKINFGNREVTLYSYNNSFIIMDEENIKEELYNFSAIPLYKIAEKNTEKYLKEHAKSFKKAFNNIEYHCKDYDIEEKVIKKEDKEKICKKIIFKKDKSFVELKDKKIRYCTIIDNIKYYYEIKNEKDLFKKKITKWTTNAITYAEEVIGCEYSQEKRTENFKYYDCSSLVYYAYKNNDIILCDKEGYPPTAAEEAKWLKNEGKFKEVKEIEEEKLKIGDLIFYSYEKNDRYLNISHVAMYIGDGKIIHAANKNKGVCKEDVKFNCMVGYATVK